MADLAMFVFAAVVTGVAGSLFAFFPTRLIRWTGLGNKFMTERILGLTLDELPAKRRELICQAIVAPGELVALTWWCRIIGIFLLLAAAGEIVGTAYWLVLGAGKPVP